MFSIAPDLRRPFSNTARHALEASLERRTLYPLLYGGLAVGALAGVAISTYFWRQHARALSLINVPPLQRAEELIASCETKLEDIERALADLQSSRS